MVRWGGAVLVLLGLIGGSGRVDAAFMVDQQDANTGGVSFGGTSVGQSFRPSLGRNDFAMADLEVSTGTSSVNVVVDVRAGDGTTGTLLGTSAATSFSNSSFATVQFNFTTSVALTTGSVYTLVFRSLGGSFDAQYDPSNTYAGGSLYIGSTVASNFDLTFSEGINSTSVPEPSSVLGVGVGLACLVGLAAGRRGVVRR